MLQQGIQRLERNNAAKYIGNMVDDKKLCPLVNCLLCLTEKICAVEQTAFYPMHKSSPNNAVDAKPNCVHIH